jgi:hypothetical protein
MNLKQYAILMVISFCLSSCMLIPAKPVTTKQETINALLGTWKPRDAEKSQVKSIDFEDKDANGRYRLIIKIARDSTEVQTFDGTWQYVDVGSAVLYYSMNLSSDVMLRDSKLMLVEGTAVFEKN